MTIRKLILTLAAVTVSTPALAAASAPVASEAEGAAEAGRVAAAEQHSAKGAFSTGVAKGRDLLDTAISASTINEADFPKLVTTSLAGMLGNIPGIRVENPGVDGYTSITVRGLPLAADGSKFIQIEEDGLPVLEFGDVHFGTFDQFVRPDLGLAQIQAIRGGSASTFASNSPGGVINLISKTGETTGGAIQTTTELGSDLNRIDFDYGASLGGGWRFHVGGFYREGSGARPAGYTAFRGGQFKANVTKEFAGGYVRLYAKYLDDREPNYSLVPITIAGTNAAPTFANLPGFDVLKDTLVSQYTATFAGIGDDNQVTTVNMRNGNRGVVKALGLEAKFDVASWTIVDKFRFAGISGEYNESVPLIIAPTAAVGTILGGPGASLRYVNGPRAGQVITSPQTLNGNGLLSYSLGINAKLRNFDDVTNDLRASRVWDMGEGKLTTTAGVYFASQNINMYWNFTSLVQDVAGGGRSALVDVIAANGAAQTQDGIYAYGVGVVSPLTSYHRAYDVNYRVLAPYASLNYQLGKISLGGSLRYDDGKVTGSTFGADLGGGRNGVAAIDVNGNGVISAAEGRVAILPLGRAGAVNYGYDYLSYSGSVNYRVADNFSAFARYSKGARAGAERILFPPSLNADTGLPTDPETTVAPVKQAEVGVKLRSGHAALYVTGFWASTSDHNYQIGADATGQVIVIHVDRDYSAKGIELEGEFHQGPFALTLGATYTKAKIDRDLTDPTLNGNTPRHQPSLFFSARPEFANDLLSIGATINGTTSSYAQDVNLLKQPGYVIVSPYLQVRPMPRVQFELSAFNLFDKLAFTQVSSSAIPASGLVTAQPINGRVVTASVRFDF